MCGGIQIKSGKRKLIRSREGDEMPKVLFVVPYAKYYLNFNRDLLESLIRDGHSVTALAPDTIAEDTLAAMGVKFVRVPIRNTGLNPLYDLRSILHLVRIIGDEDPDIISCYSIKPVLYGSLAARLANKGRVFVNITGLGYMFMERTWKQRMLMPIVKTLYRQAFRHCEGAFFENEDDLQLFTNIHFIQREKATIVNGVGVNLTSFRKPSGRTVKAPVTFILIARIIKAKGIYEYIEAARILKKKYPDIGIKLLGPFDVNPTAIREDQMTEWINEQVVDYLGETRDVRPHLNSSDVFVLPSYYREGTPKSILEAMSMGMPVITTNTPGCKETVIQEYNGFLVPVKNAAALAEAMERFILDPGLIERMGACSRDIAEQKYDVHKVNSRIRSVMQI